MENTKSAKKVEPTYYVKLPAAVRKKVIAMAKKEDRSIHWIMCKLISDSVNKAA